MHLMETTERPDAAQMWFWDIKDRLECHISEVIWLHIIKGDYAGIKSKGVCLGSSK